MKYYLTYIFLCAGFLISNSLFAQDAIDNAIAKGNWQLAAIECERACFLTDNEVQKNKFIIKKAWCLENNLNYKGAIEELKRINVYSLPDSLNELWLFKMSFYCYLSEEFAEAENNLIQLMGDSTSEKYQKYGWLKLMCLNEQYKWKESLKLSMQLNECKNNKQLISLYSPKNYPKIKSADKAKKMNLFLPGLGYLYTGYIVEGIVSTGLVVTSLVITGGAIYYGYYLSALMGGAQLFQMFYTGAVRRVEFLAEKHNYTVSKKYNEELKKLILAGN